MKCIFQFNFLSISVNTCKRDPLNFGPIRMCKIIIILSVKIVWYTQWREARGWTSNGAKGQVIIPIIVKTVLIQIEFTLKRGNTRCL